jgi:hypothetical protein
LKKISKPEDDVFYTLAPESFEYLRSLFMDYRLTESDLVYYSGLFKSLGVNLYTVSIEEDYFELFGVGPKTDILKHVKFVRVVKEGELPINHMIT